MSLATSRDTPRLRMPGSQQELQEHALSAVQRAYQRAWPVLAKVKGTPEDRLRDLWRSIETRIQAAQRPEDAWTSVSFWDALSNAATLTPEAALDAVLVQTNTPPIALAGFAPPPRRGAPVELPAVHLPLLPIHRTEDGHVTIATDLPFFGEEIVQDFALRASLAACLGAADVQVVLVSCADIRARLAQCVGATSVFRPLLDESRRDLAATAAPRLPRLSLSGFQLPPEVMQRSQRLLTVGALRAHTMAPVHCGGRILTLALIAPPSSSQASQLSSALATHRFGVRYVLASADQVAGLVGGAQRAESAAASEVLAKSLRPLTGARATVEATAIAPISIVAANGVSADEAAVQFVSNALYLAQTRGASDLKLMSVEDSKAGSVILRTKVNGVWSFEEHAVAAGGLGGRGVMARVKVLAGLSEGALVKPEDGAIRVMVGGKEVLFRINLTPSNKGEVATLRLQDNSAVPTMEYLRMPANVSAAVLDMANRKSGLVVITGPTGSGKTTTLHAVLVQLPAHRLNIITFESPIERDLPRIDQILCDDGTGAYRGPTFSEGARAALRMAPDVCLIGETRDEATVESLLRLAQSGHRTYTTLHANSAYHVPARFFDLGSKLTSLTPGVLADVLLGAVSQRLLEVPCPHCAEEVKVTELERRWLDPTWLVDGSGKDVSTLIQVHEDGCAHCGGSGRAGRYPVYEILLNTPEVSQLIVDRASTDQLANHMVEAGFPRLIESATRLAAAHKVCWKDSRSYR